jgi:transcriptional regulator GlxA family with amidase domain
MAIWDSPTEIGLLLYPGYAASTIHGLTDMFTVATTLARQHLGANAPMLRVSHWQPDVASDTIDCVFDTHPALDHRVIVVIVPGSWKGEPDPQRRIGISRDRWPNGFPKFRSTRARSSSKTEISSRQGACLPGPISA